MNNFFTEIKAIADQYESNLQLSNTRRQQWTQQIPMVKSVLDSIATYLNDNTLYFKSNIYVETSEIQNVYLYSGKVPIATGVEQGFYIMFVPSLTGYVHVLVNGHAVEGISAKGESLGIFEPLELTTSKIQEIVLQGMEWIKGTSYLFNK